MLRTVIAVAAAVAGSSATTVTAATEASSLSAGDAASRSCTAAVRNDDAADRMSVRVPGPAAMVTARMRAGGNWDLAIFDEDGRTVAGSTYAGGEEIAQGFAATRTLIVQACRISGPDREARVSVETHAVTEPAERMQMVRVATPTDASEDELLALGLDLTEHGGPGFVDVVLHGPADAALLAANGFTHEVLIDDLLERSLADRAAERVARRQGAGPGLPSGRTGTYRRLFDYSAEMQALASEHPDLVRYFTLPEQTYEGRPVEAIEVAPKVARRDGRPTMVMLGVHHAREWPAGELTLEFAHELVNGWTSGNTEIRNLMRRTRVVFVPIVNPDGFNTSREAGERGGVAGGREVIGTEVPALLLPYEYQRKNCRFLPPNEAQGGSCSQTPSTGLAQFGVDPNRNYGAYWGGPGAEPPDGFPFGELAQNYRGPAPFSEPETRNIRWLVSRRQVTTLITNHTVAALVLRPPGLQAQGPAPDEVQLKKLADAMAAQNGYTSQLGYELYDTTGTTEDWSYSATGGFGFTFELGGTGFHSPYAAGVVDEYVGNAEGATGGNRMAYLIAMRSTMNRRRHALISGRAPAGAKLTLTKRFETPTSPVIDGTGTAGEVLFTREFLRTRLKVSSDGRFRWDVNPSTRPLLLAAKGVPAAGSGEPSAPISFAAGADTALPCANSESPDASCWNDHAFTVPGGAGVDNGQATVRIVWPTPVSDWDMQVYRDSNGDGSSVGETELVGSSASGLTNVEETTIGRPQLSPGAYVVRVINYAGVEPYDGRVVFNKTAPPPIPYEPERWRLSCKRKGEVVSRRHVRVERGERKVLDLRRACDA